MTRDAGLGAELDEAGQRLLERARALAPLLAAEAAEAETLRRPTDAAIAAMRESGIFELMVPRAFGGLELDLDCFVEVGLALAEGDASMAWVANFYIEHNWMLCQLPESFQKACYAEKTHRLAPAAIAPTGIARPEPGGYRLNGRWNWGTGAMHGDLALVGAPVEGVEGDLRFFTLDYDQIEVDDVWFVDGMAATGSNDLVVTDAFVPEERTVSILRMLDGRGFGAELHAAPLYRTPMIPILALAAAMPAVGQARAAVDRFAKDTRERVRFGSAVRQAEKPALQMRLARAELESAEAARALRRIAREVMSLREEARPADRARWVATGAWAVHLAKGALDSLADVSGGSAHFNHHPLQRAVRDVRTLSSHVVFDLDGRLESYGRTLLGLEPSGMV